MRLLFKQRVFSWFDSYDIYDENGDTIFIVKGQLSWGHRLNIYDASEQYLATVQEKVLTFPSLNFTLQVRVEISILEKFKKNSLSFAQNFISMSMAGISREISLSGTIGSLIEMVS